MCIIIVKPKGVEMPSEQILRNCQSSNRDGFGAMYRRNDGCIQIDKGYMSLQEVLTWRERNAERLRDTDVVMHFRLSTHGGVSQGNTHPFPITHNIEDLRRLSFVCRRAIAHNGVLNEFGKAKSTLSDTMIFVKHLAGMTVETFVGSAISKQVGKFCYMNATDTIMFGQFNEEKGIFYSNYGFRTSGVSVYSYNGGCANTASFLSEKEDVLKSPCDRDCHSCTKEPCIWEICGSQHDCEHCEHEVCLYEIAYKRMKEIEDRERLKEYESACTDLTLVQPDL